MLKPLSNYIVCDIIETDSKIVTLDKKRLPRDRVSFIVIRISEDTDLNGKPLIRTVKVGDNVIPDTNQGLGTILKIDNKEVLVIRETQILGILEESYEEKLQEKMESFN